MQGALLWEASDMARAQCWGTELLVRPAIAAAIAPSLPANKLSQSYANLSVQLSYARGFDCGSQACCKLRGPFGSLNTVVLQHNEPPEQEPQNEPQLQGVPDQRPSPRPSLPRCPQRHWTIASAPPCACQLQQTAALRNGATCHSVDG